MYRFVVFLDRGGEYRWSFHAPNGQPTAVASEGYSTRHACLVSIELVKRNAPGAPVDDLTLGPAIYGSRWRFEIYRDRAGEYRWTFVASNNSIIAVSEGYTLKTDCRHSVEILKLYAPGAPVEDRTGQVPSRTF